MKTMDDLRTVRFSIQCGITLDRERLEEDPVWKQFTWRHDVNTESGLCEALTAYLRYYLQRDTSLLAEMPATNGPADVYGIISSEVIPVDVPGFGQTGESPQAEEKEAVG
jgi:hypothetical protein